MSRKSKCKFYVMVVHLLKLCVGVEKPEELADWQNSGRADWPMSGGGRGVAHITRMTPKRADTLIETGSLYWVIRGQILVRQKILALDPTVRDGKPYCAIVMDPALFLTRPRPHRPFQGWRYMEEAKAPKDIGPLVLQGMIAARYHSSGN